MPKVVVSRPAAGKAADLEDPVKMTEMVQACSAVAEAAWRNPTDEQKVFWFGSTAKLDARKKEIDELAHKLFDFLQLKDRTVNFVCMAQDKEGESFADYAQYANEKTWKGLPFYAAERSKQCKLEVKIILGNGFRMAKYSWGEKVRAILHELTHATIGTVDVPKENPTYGDKRCTEFAKANSETAYINADNWAYYLASYHDSTAYKNKDWKPPA